MKSYLTSYLNSYNNCFKLLCLYSQVEKPIHVVIWTHTSSNMHHDHLVVKEDVNSYLFLINSVAPEAEISSPRSQEPATSPHHEPTESTHTPLLISPRSILLPFSHLLLGLPSGLCPSDFATKTLHTFLSSPNACHMPFPPHLPRLNLPGDEYKVWSFSLCNFLHSPVTSSLLSKSILLSYLWLFQS
jgi:hypothetical protein